MCEHSTKLIAWLDGELSAEDAAAMEQHVRDCRACSEQIGKYRKVSKWMDDYGDAALAAQAERPWPAGTAVVSASAAALALLIVFFLAPRKPAANPDAELRSAGPVASAMATSIPAPDARALPQAAPVVVKKKVRLRPAAAPESSQVAEWQPAEPTIQVAIPADEMFAPGAVPEGLEFVANVSIASDGSLRQLGVVPATNLPR